MAGEESLIRFLSDPRSYPEEPSAIAHYETHISHVFVGDAHAYKIKKAVDLGFLDFTSLGRRHFFCRQEVKLNSRLAEGFYLGVVPIFRRSGTYSFSRMRGAAVAEYAIRMKRIPEELLLSFLIREGRLLSREAREVGERIALFHRSVRPYRGAAYGGLRSVRTNTEENFDQIGQFRGTILEAAVYSRLVGYTRSFVVSRQGLFEERKKGGFVREGHGDMHTQHVCLVHPPAIVDCIEFNKRFRIIDVLEDLAFLLMDLEFQGRFDLAERVSSVYFSAFPGAYAPDLLGFCKVYRAIVRGKIEAFTAGAVDGEAGARALRRSRDYFSLADHYVTAGDKRFNPVVFMGPSGAGKSAVASRLFRDDVHLRSDEARKDAEGIAPGQHVYVDYGKGLYGPDVTARTYEALGARAVEAALAGRRVAVDATFLRAEQRLSFFHRCMRAGLNPFFVYCYAPETVLLERVRRRREKGHDVSDAHEAILTHQLRTVEDPAELPSFRVLRLNTEDGAETIALELAPILGR